MKLRSSFKKPFELAPPSKIIIDTHGGLQDILAIVFAHNYIKNSGSGQQIIGITCVTGKNTLDIAVKSALVANKLLGTKIPVYRGQKESLMLSKQYPKIFLDQKFSHVQQALYTQVEHDENLKNLVQKQKAVDYLDRICKQHGKDLGIVCFGPLTNIGLSHRLQGSLNHVKMISLTGGQLIGMGNTFKGHVQANFAHDPLAAHVVFEKKLSGQYLKDKIYVNVIQNTLTFCFKQAINFCLDTGKLDPQIEDILVNMMGINSIVVNCGPILSIVPLLAPKSVKHQYHAYGQIVRDAELLDGLLAINWLKSGAQPGQYDSFFYLYDDYDKQYITELFMTAFVNKDKPNQAA